jgi:hypothetical protein
MFIHDDVPLTRLAGLIEAVLAVAPTAVRAFDQ